MSTWRCSWFSSDFLCSRAPERNFLQLAPFAFSFRPQPQSFKFPRSPIQQNHNITTMASEEKVARRALYWLQKLTEFADGHADGLEDADARYAFGSQTRNLILQEVVRLKTQPCSLDSLAFQVYRRVRLQAENAGKFPVSGRSVRIGPKDEAHHGPQTRTYRTALPISHPTNRRTLSLSTSRRCCRR
jgi:hypothetical protein